MANTLITPTVIPSAFCSNGDKNTILANPSTSSPQLANYSTGFPAITQTPIPNGGIPPERADFNGLFNMLSSALFFQQNGGKWTFVPEVSQAIGGYPKGAILSYTNSTDGTVKTVVSNINNNVNNFLLDPSQIGDSSKPWSYTESIPIAQDLTNPDENTVPSTKAVSDEFSTVVHKTGNETINGVKTFTQHSYWANDLADDVIVQKNTGYDRTETPTAFQQRSFRITDKNSKIVGDFRTYADTLGNVFSAILARKSIDGVEKTAQVTARVGADGALSAYAPSARTSTSGAIVTWNDMQVVNALPTNPVAGVFYFVKE